MMDFRNAVYSRPDNSAVDMEVDHPKHGWVPFTATAHDPEDYGRELFDAAISGAVAPYVPPSVETIREGLSPISARQLRLVLIRNGISLASVQTAIGAIADVQAREEALVEWEYATSFDRLHPLLLAIADAFSLTPERVDDLWADAVAIQ